MQRKGNTIRSESQVKNQISVGIDMGGSLWATAVQDWEAGKMSYYGLKDKVDQSGWSKQRGSRVWAGRKITSERQTRSDPESLELVEVKPLQTDARNGSGIRLLVDGTEIAIEKGFDGTTLSEVLNLLKARSCSASAVR